MIVLAQEQICAHDASLNDDKFRFWLGVWGSVGNRAQTFLFNEDVIGFVEEKSG